MKPPKISEPFSTILGLAVQLARATKANALLVLLDAPTDWEELKRVAGDKKIVIAADEEIQVEGAKQAGLATVVRDSSAMPVQEKLAQALLNAVASEILDANADVVAVYAGFEPDMIDSISFIQLDEHLGRLTSQDLRQLRTKVPLETLKMVVDLAVEIGREGREGKPVGTLFVIGDARKVLAASQPSGFDPMKGYSRKDRRLQDPRVREGIKEIAQLDGAFVVAADGTVEAACRLLDVSSTGITMSKGLGARHLAAAAITKKTESVAAVVSESNGTVRLFQQGEVILRIEPFRRAMKWKEFQLELSDSSE
ncbi:MAG: DNA integrity scanning protein DisA nucleotide-binding domain protein [Planctomycetota bacterium]|nr:DNA integrity scanning protein DisA nucleotide-binding domain protein [Planctomycetota bacterium]MDA1179163.1 DNA integrity scanning protein DisA nucleotide-binding domain protein [Planctomycetota bacterium]